MANKKNASQPPDFDQALSTLESIVSNMENGDLTLEQALKQFEQGVALARECQQALATAQKRVQQLVEEDNDPTSDKVD